MKETCQFSVASLISNAARVLIYYELLSPPGVLSKCVFKGRTMLQSITAAPFLTFGNHRLQSFPFESYLPQNVDLVAFCARWAIICFPLYSARFIGSQSFLKTLWSPLGRLKRQELISELCVPPGKSFLCVAFLGQSVFPCQLQLL